MKKYKSFYLWSFSVVFTLVIAYYQRITGPTYPVNNQIIINSKLIKYKLPRSFGGAGNAEIKITVPDTSINGIFKYKRFKSFDEWAESPMLRVGVNLVASIPHQPPAGKVIYEIYLGHQNKHFVLTKEPVIIRFRGDVPPWILIPHIILMFAAMLLSTRTGVEAILKGKNTFKYTIATVITLLIGGAILGPLVQKYAFDAYWTGWPFGHDLTDNKTLIALLLWIIALVIIWRKKTNRFWPIFAAMMLLAVYLVPHSVLGSEIDYTKQNKIEINNN